MPAVIASARVSFSPGGEVGAQAQQRRGGIGADSGYAARLSLTPSPSSSRPALRRQQLDQFGLPPALEGGDGTDFRALLWSPSVVNGFFFAGGFEGLAPDRSSRSRCGVDDRLEREQARGRSTASSSSPRPRLRPPHVSQHGVWSAFQGSASSPSRLLAGAASVSFSRRAASPTWARSASPSSRLMISGVPALGSTLPETWIHVVIAEGKRQPHARSRRLRGMVRGDLLPALPPARPFDQPGDCQRTLTRVGMISLEAGHIREANFSRGSWNIHAAHVRLDSLQKGKLALGLALATRALEKGDLPTFGQSDDSAL